jgi:hypothetical protein
VVAGSDAEQDARGVGVNAVDLAGEAGGGWIDEDLIY